MKQISETLKIALNSLYKQGFNIYALLGKLKKQLHWPKEQHFPEEILLKVCDYYNKNNSAIKNKWAWFIISMKEASKEYFAKKNVKEGAAFKKEPVSELLKDLIKGIGDL